MKKLTKIILSLVLVLAVACATATNYQAAEKATAGMVNGYDWTATGGPQVVYIYATADETQSISSLTGQTADVFQWWWVVLLEETSNGLYKVTASDLGANNNGIAATLGEGKVALMAHDSNKNADDFNFLKGLKVGDTVKLSKSFADMAAQEWGSAYPVSIEKASAPAEDAKPSTPSTDTKPSTPSTDSTDSTTDTTTGTTNNVPATGDSMPVALMASVLLASVAIVAYGLKKRNA